MLIHHYKFRGGAAEPVAKRDSARAMLSSAARLKKQCATNIFEVTWCVVKQVTSCFPMPRSNEEDQSGEGNPTFPSPFFLSSSLAAALKREISYTKLTVRLVNIESTDHYVNGASCQR